MPVTFDAFFQSATGNEPYGYQRRLACGEPTCPEPAERSRTAARLCALQLISILAGLAVI